MVSAIDIKELWECETVLVWERVRIWEVGMDRGIFFFFHTDNLKEGEALAKGRWEQLISHVYYVFLI